MQMAYSINNLGCQKVYNKRFSIVMQIRFFKSHHHMEVRSFKEGSCCGLCIRSMLLHYLCVQRSPSLTNGMLVRRYHLNIPPIKCIILAGNPGYPRTLLYTSQPIGEDLARGSRYLEIGTTKLTKVENCEKKTEKRYAAQSVLLCDY